MINLIKKIIRKRRFYSGPYHNWDLAIASSTGYDSDEIFNKIKSSATKVKNSSDGYERDSIIFYDKNYDQNLIKIFDNLDKNEKKMINILDFGGSLGSLYFKYKNKINKKFIWSIIEQKKFAEEGILNFQSQQLRFFYNLADYKNFFRADLLILSSSLQYLKNYKQVLNELIKLDPKYIVILKTPFSFRLDDEIYIQKVSKNIYNASYPTWIFNYHNFINNFRTNFELISKFSCEPFVYNIEYLIIFLKNKNV